MMEVIVVVGAGSIGQAIARRVAGKKVPMSTATPIHAMPE
jgi:predicted dinucleotide-binding enzyme